MKHFKYLSEVDGITVEKSDKTFKFIKDGIEMELDRDFIYQILMLYGLPKQQEDLVVVSNKKMRTVRRQLNIKAKKNIKEGENIVVEIDFPVSEDVADKIEQFKIK